MTEKQDLITYILTTTVNTSICGGYNGIYADIFTIVGRIPVFFDTNNTVDEFEELKKSTIYHAIKTQIDYHKMKAESLENELFKYE